MKPSYRKVSDEIKEMLSRGVWKVGDKLPSEIEMAKRFKVSRETFRSAVSLLEKEGRLVAKQGVGTFVVKPLPHIDGRVEKLSSVTKMIKSAGLKEGERKQSITIETCNEELAGILHCQLGDSVIVIERIRTADGDPVVVSRNYIPLNIGGEDMVHLDEIGSLFTFLEEERGVHITCADTELVIPLHTDKLCQKLLVRPETTVLMMKQLHYHYDNTPVLYSIDYFRNDIFKFFVRRVRDNNED